jgi:predicted nucleic acid-binding Zn ribbon protein
MCSGRIEVLQAVDEESIPYCPHCGLPVKRVVSRAAFSIKKGFTFQKAADRGFTSFRRVGKGQWEKIAGEGVDAIVAAPEDVEDEGKPSGD